VPSTVWPRTQTACAVVAGRSARFDFIADVCTGDAIVRVVGKTQQHAVEVLVEIDAGLRRALPGMTVLAGDPHLRAQVDAWGSVPPGMETLRSIKARFDPEATLAPGRYVGGL
jgi:hypothetical protein